MKLKDTLIVLMLFASLGFYGCKKQTNEVSINENIFNPVMKPYVFDTGTYWIYEKVDTQGVHFIDSQYVTSVIHINNHIQQKGLNVRYTGYHMNINSRIPGWNPNMYVIGSAISGEPDYSGIYFEWHQDTSTKGLSHLEYSHYYDSLFVNGIRFYQVRQCDNYSWADLTQKISSVWVSPNVGIIKQVVYLDNKQEVISVKRYKTKPYLF